MIFGDYSKTSYRFSFPAFFLLCSLIGGLKLKTKFWINPLLFPALFQKLKGKGHFKRSKFTLNLLLRIQLYTGSLYKTVHLLRSQLSATKLLCQTFFHPFFFPYPVLRKA